MNTLAVPFHFISSFLVSIAALGGVWVAAQRPRAQPEDKSEPLSNLGILRLPAAVGWLLVAAGEMIHGTDLIKEPSALTVGLRSAGYILVAVILLFAYRRRPAAVVSLGAGLVFLVISESLLSVVAGLHSGPATTNWFLVHGLRIAAGLLLLGWLWLVIRTSIQARFVAIVVLLLIVVVVVIAGAMGELFASNIEQESLRRAAREGEVQLRLLDAQVAESVSRARQVAELDSVRDAVARRDPVLTPTVERLQGPGGPFDSSDFMAFLDNAGAVLALSAKDPNDQVVLSPSDALGLVGAEVVQEALSGGEAGSIDTIGPDKIGLVGAFPVFNPSGFDAPGSPRGLAGVVALGRVFDRNFLTEILREEDQEAFIINRDRVLLQTIQQAEGVFPRDRTRERVFEEGRSDAVQAVIGDEQYFSSYVPLKQADGEVIGALVISQRSEVIAATQSEVARTIFLVALFATIIGVALSYLLGSRITKPIRDLTEAAEKVRKGELTTRVGASGVDEVGELGETFDQMAASVETLTGQLRESADLEFEIRSRLETILQAMTDGVVGVDEEGRVVVFNREAERITGMAEGSAQGRHVREVLVLTDPSGKEVDLPIYRLGAGFTEALAGSENGGEPMPVAVNSSIIETGSGVVGAVAVVRDLTREVEVERLKSNFLSNVSHELKTPLTPIKGYSDLLRRKIVPRQKAIKFLDGIVSSADRLERIVEMLVDFSAMEAGLHVPRKIKVDLNKQTTELVGKWETASPLHDFQRKGFSKIPTVEVDEKLVPLVVGELLDNAVKFSPKGGKVGLVGELTKTNGRETLRITVSDQGIGISPDQLSTISQSFAQVDSSSTRAYGGLGLGLAYVRRIVEAHGGKLEVASTPGKGSAFTLSIPAKVLTTSGRPKGRPS